MGSGETSPTMVTPHQRVLAESPGRRVVLDTPFGFQENADILTGRLVDYFRESVRVAVAPVVLRRSDQPPASVGEAIAARLRLRFRAAVHDDLLRTLAREHGGKRRVEPSSEPQLRERIANKTLAIDFTLGLEQGTGAEADEGIHLVAGNGLGDGRHIRRRRHPLICRDAQRWKFRFRRTRVAVGRGAERRIVWNFNHQSRLAPEVFTTAVHFGISALM